MRKTLAKAGTGASMLITVGLIALALGAPAAGALESKNDAWAVIFATPAGSDNGPMAEGWALHNWLINHGWMDSHIKFLADFTGADAAPTKENLQGAIAELAQKSNSNSLVVISVMDHGEFGMVDSYFNAKNGLVSGVELSGWVNGIANYKSMVVEASFRYSGGFLSPMGGASRVVVTSHATTEGGLPNHYSLSEGLSASGADTNGDGYVSVQEAHAFECAKIARDFPGSQHPQMDSNGGTVILSVS